MAIPESKVRAFDAAEHLRDDFCNASGFLDVVEGDPLWPEVESIGTYTAQFTIELDGLRFRVDVSDIN